MGRARGVTTEIDQLPLSDGDWVQVRRFLAAGPRMEVSSIATLRLDPGTNLRIYCHRKIRLGPMAQYIVAWSLVDHEGKAIFWAPNLSLERRIDILGTLDEETIAEIETAMEGHVAAQKKSRPATTGSPVSTD